MNSVDFEHDLNEEQKKAALAPDGPSLILAGAGSGKTRVLTYRAAYLLSKGVPFHRILLLTFTKKSAIVMQNRLKDLLGDHPPLPWAGTFHHVGFRLIREFGQRMGLTSPLTIMDREDQLDMIKALVDTVATKDSDFPPASLILNIMSLASNKLMPLEELLGDRYPHLFRHLSDLEEIARRYLVRKQDSRLLDYDDLLLYWYRLLDDPEILPLLQARFRFILVDEYQDTNPLQAALLDRLAQGHQQLFAVGDDSQSIYSFRGANVENMLSFSERYPSAEVFRLETNYRSTVSILEIANRVILQNQRQLPKVLRSVLDQGSLPECVTFYSDIDQAQYVAKRISQKEDRGEMMGEVCVLYRSHYLSLSIQIELARRRIPFTLTSGLRFYEQAHIKDILAYLRLVLNPRDSSAFSRLLRMIPKVGPKATEKILQWMGTCDDPIEALCSLQAGKIVTPKLLLGVTSLGERLSSLRRSYSAGTNSLGYLVREILSLGYQKELYDIRENPQEREEDLEAFAKQLDNQSDLESFLSEIALLESFEESALDGSVISDRVVLSSIHQAKGLEWDTVFLLSVNEGLFPSEKSLERISDIEEERRLFYVAVTRARKELVLCVPKSAQGRGRYTPLAPSRFLLEAGSESFSHEDYEHWYS
ncbi:MAG: ATP-dependent helicase [Leptospirillum sp.]|jgi:DNA helicase-2/ATP-dependent DNA helicase PcrA